MIWFPEQKDYRYLTKNVVDAMNAAFRDMKQSEPQLVANLVWHLPNAINETQYSNGYSLKSGGVFVHSQPQVKFYHPDDADYVSVEIGDLLLLRTSVMGGRVCDRSALLLQAKKVDKIPSKPDNKNQLFLYAWWPEFSYVRSTKKLNGKRRHVVGLDIYNASKYLLISEEMRDVDICVAVTAILLGCSYFYKGFIVTAQPAIPELTHYRYFFAEIIDFILGNAGKSYVYPPLDSTNWDQVVADLIKVTSERNHIFLGRASNGISKTRGQGVLNAEEEHPHFTSGHIPSSSALAGAGILNLSTLDDEHGPPRVPEKWGDDENYGVGVSIIEIVVESEE